MPLLQRVLLTLCQVVSEIHVVTNMPEKYRAWVNGLTAEIRGTAVDVIDEPTTGLGPLGGLAAAFEALSGVRALVVGCDMPFLDVGLMRELLAAAGKSPDADVHVPLWSAGLEPLHAVYSDRCLEAVRAAIREGRRRTVAFYPAVAVEYLAVENQFSTSRLRRAFFNVNTAQDLEEALGAGGKDKGGSQLRKTNSGSEAPAQAASGHGPRPPAVLQVVGYSETGKTTLIEKLLPVLAARGLRVAAIKHAPGHPKVVADEPGTDSWRYAHAGAEVAGLITDGGLALFWPDPGPANDDGATESGRSGRDTGDGGGAWLARAIAALSGVCDLVLVEGFKSVRGPRVEVSAGDGRLVSAPEDGLIAVVGAIVGAPPLVPVFRRDEITALSLLVVETLGLRRGPARRETRFARRSKR